MISHAEPQPHIGPFKETFPELRYEFGIPVRDDGLGQVPVFVNKAEKFISANQGIVILPPWDKPKSF